jgi:predicted TIM-barrel fold metal-dependent hydrolase
MKKVILIVFAGAAITSAAPAQTADPPLMAEIRKIQAIDNHSHPPRLVAPGERDDEFDALPCDPLEPTMSPTTARPENPQILAAWKALWGYAYKDRSESHVREMLQTKERIKHEQGDNYSAWVLGKLGIETELANRIALGRGLTPPHFRWVPFDDPLLVPFPSDALADQTPDRAFFYTREAMLLDRYLKELGVASLPTSLRDYVSRIVTPELERQKQNGAVAIKFEAAYLRSLDFEPESDEDAATIYLKYSGGGTPSKSEYLHLQDYLFRTIAREAGRLGLPVHIHTGAGCGGYFELHGSNPLLLESVLDDPTLRKTTFVLLHGGAGAFSDVVAVLLMKPNVYTDMSEQTWATSPRRLAGVLRYWLEWYPEKVMYGTDLYPGEKEFDWEEIGYQTSQTGREALGIALTGMMQDGEISRERALEIARMVLRGNALKLYGWPEARKSIAPKIP